MTFNFSWVVRALKAFHAPLELLEVQAAKGFNQLTCGGRSVENICELLWRLQLFDSLRKRPVVEARGGFGDDTQGFQRSHRGSCSRRLCNELQLRNDPQAVRLRPLE